MNEERQIQLDEVISSREGTVEFTLEIPDTLQSGLDVVRSTHPLLQLPSLATVEFRAAPSGWGLWWVWETKSPFYHILQGFPEWPAGRYCIQYTWRADEGLLQLFINGTPTRVPEARFEQPWSFNDEAIHCLLPESPFTVTDFHSSSDYTRAEDLQKRVPQELLGQHADLFWDFPEVTNPIEVDATNLVLLYENELAHSDDLEAWVMEGPGKIEFNDGWMQMRSTRPNVASGENGHFVHWMPQKLPESFVAEWEVQLLNDPGLLIGFFAADGAEGMDLFDSALPPRDGTFGYYVNGAINCYHISYYSNPEHEPGRTTSNMRKNPPAMMVEQGPVGIEPGSKQIHRVRLVKSDAEVQMSVVGRIVIRWTDDDADRFGAAYGGGYLGFRQMQWTEARYRNLKVYGI